MKNLFLTLILLHSAVFTFSQSSNGSITSTESSTISITDDNRDYTVIANFSKAKLPMVKSLITEALGKTEHAEKELDLWKLKETYTVTLRPERLRIEFNKDKSSGALITTFEHLSQQLQRTLGTPKPPAKL